MLLTMLSIYLSPASVLLKEICDITRNEKTYSLKRYSLQILIFYHIWSMLTIWADSIYAIEGNQQRKKQQRTNLSRLRSILLQPAGGGNDGHSFDQLFAQCNQQGPRRKAPMVKPYDQPHGYVPRELSVSEYYDYIYVSCSVCCFGEFGKSWGRYFLLTQVSGSWLGKSERWQSTRHHGLQIWWILINPAFVEYKVCRNWILTFISADLSINQGKLLDTWTIVVIHGILSN